MITHKSWISSNITEHCAKDVDFLIDLKPYKFREAGFDEAAKAAAELIAEETEKPLFVALSGGSDSEYVVRLFNRLKIPFTAVIADHGLNPEEVEYAYAVCDELGVKQEVMLIDERSLATAIFESFQEKNVSSLYSIATLLIAKSVSDRGGQLITGDSFRQDVDFKTIVVENHEFYGDVFGWEIIGFYYYTVELAYAAIKAISSAETVEDYKAKTYGTDIRPKFRPSYSQKTMAIYDFTKRQKKSIAAHNLGRYDQFLRYLECWKK